ncbi:MAG TPA: DUF4390 domain-containing protein [Vicinamibacterales bacterium]
MRPAIRLAVACIWGCAIALAPAAAAAPDQVIEVTPQARDDIVLVSFSTNQAVTAAIAQAIESGLPTTFTYDVELRRHSAFWFDKLIASARIAVTVRYDALTRRYQVAVMQDGRVAESRTTDSAEQMRTWVSVFRALPLFTTRELRQQTQYYVRVRGRTTPRSTWSFWPWTRASAHGSAAFVFQP